MIQISHEVPLQLLDKSREWNDYDYALVHLFKDYPEYYKFFEDSLKANRKVILDNSIFELGNSFDIDIFARWIMKLHPTEYIVPDVLEDCNATIDKFNEWMDKYPDLPGTRIGVIQGKTYSELSKCYEFMRKHADKIAISFDYSFYLSIGLGDNKWAKYADGRNRLINMLYEDSTWRDDIPHHLLGCALPNEFKRYRNWWSYYNIVTLDTSNPVQQGLMGCKYTDNGLSTKNPTMVNDTFTTEYNEEDIKIVEHNIQIFKTLCKGKI